MNYNPKSNFLKILLYHRTNPLLRHCKHTLQMDRITKIIICSHNSEIRNYPTRLYKTKKKVFLISYHINNDEVFTPSIYLCCSFTHPYSWSKCYNISLCVCVCVAMYYVVYYVVYYVMYYVMLCTMLCTMLCYVLCYVPCHVCQLQFTSHKSLLVRYHIFSK